MSVAGLLGAAGGLGIGYLITQRVRAGRAALAALPHEVAADPNLLRMNEQLARAARTNVICWALAAAALVAVILGAVLEAGDVVVHDLLLLVYASFAAALVFGIRWRVLQLRVARYSQELAERGPKDGHGKVAT